jgi:UDP-GlcNAc:undecaprenyl-phosphate/decaprenyl-phosphate GlcNAc-1-phosphate transferase
MNFFLPLVTSIIIVVCLTPAVILIATKYGLVDDPKKRFHPAHVHTGIIPRAGGLALYAGVTICMFIFLGFSKITIGLACASLILTIVGLFDDRHDVNPYIRLLTNSFAAIIIVACGAGIPYITNPFTGGLIHLDTWRISFIFFGNHSILIWADLFAFLWIMWTINIVGWSAGVDGQMPGFVAITAITLGILSMRFGLTDPTQTMVALLAFIIAGAFIGFIPWNFFPQKIMPGYSGKTLAGFYLALLGILSYGKVGTALLVLGIPTIDAIYTLLRRFKGGKPLVQADRGHLHHQLLDMGWSKRRIALFYWGVSIILGTAALLITSRQKLFTLLLISVAFGGFLLWVKYFTQFSKPSDPDNG